MLFRLKIFLRRRDGIHGLIMKHGWSGTKKKFAWWIRFSFFFYSNFGRLQFLFQWETGAFERISSSESQIEFVGLIELTNVEETFVKLL